MGFLILRLTHKREIMFDINEKDLLDLTAMRHFNGRTVVRIMPLGQSRDRK